VIIATTRRDMVTLAAGAGVIAGASYTLSPLFTICLPLLIITAVWAGRDLTERQRRWFVTLVSAGILARLVVIALLFLTARFDQPFATLFGDEELLKFRSIWIRNIGLGVPISRADLIYAYEDVGRTSYLFGLAYLQALVGAVPYGVHVMNATLYVCGALIMFRVTRPAFGAVAALAGLTLMLAFPTLFAWSISALKEPAYTFLAILQLLCTIAIVRAGSWRRRLLAIAGVVLLTMALESVRRGGMQAGAAGSIAGLALGLTWTVALARPRFGFAAIFAAPVLMVAMLAVPAVNQRLLGIVRNAAVYHGGHVMSAGYSYKILDGRYYHDGRLLWTMGPVEAGAFVVNSLVAYVTEPVPWRIESRPMLMYLPEQMLWLMVLALVPFGAVAGMRRDPILGALLICHGLALVIMVALPSGNIGTLVRHRGLALTYFAWLAGLGLCEVARLLMPRVRNAAPPSPLLGFGGTS
jgi:hypothetical protein